VQNSKNATECSYQVQEIVSVVGLDNGVVVSQQSVDEKTLKVIKSDNIIFEPFH